MGVYDSRKQGEQVRVWRMGGVNDTCDTIVKKIFK